MMNIKDLNASFAIENKLHFVDAGKDKGHFPWVEINNQYAKAEACLYGAQVMSFVPKDGQELLFVSEKAYYQEGKAIKGGVPICWPWFGDDPEGLGRSAHGFARNRLWEVVTTQMTDDGETQLVLGLDDSEETFEIWPNSFSLRLTITIGQSLKLDLQTTNKDDEYLLLTQALHSYFSVENVVQASVLGLDEVQYIDKLLDTQALQSQQGAITIDQEVDRIYLDAPSELNIVDTSAKRNIQLHSVGSQSAVVWNPWIDGAKAMSDLQDNDYQKFICVETTNAGADVVEVMPGESHSLGVIITLKDS